MKSLGIEFLSKQYLMTVITTNYSDYSSFCSKNIVLFRNVRRFNWEIEQRSAATQEELGKLYGLLKEHLSI